tara:strand:- start:83 stop:331 length:249 start_codon:yes stop_codon:yes gene_type:complete
MPQSKHYKKGQTARQWRKKRNLRKAEAQKEAKFKKRMEFLKLVQSMQNRELEAEAEADMVTLELPVTQSEKEMLETNEKKES